jgi:hypothetical protein
MASFFAFDCREKCVGAREDIEKYYPWLLRHFSCAKYEYDDTLKGWEAAGNV